jgi:high-affinity Fe2+/Pb2+ permease
MADPSTRRTIGMALAGLTGVLFIVQLVALALGRFEIAAVCAALFVVGWFALRSWQKSMARKAAGGG